MTEVTEEQLEDRHPAVPAAFRRDLRRAGRPVGQQFDGHLSHTDGLYLTVTVQPRGASARWTTTAPPFLLAAISYGRTTRP